MPYKNVQDAEKKNPALEKYSEKAKRGWVSAFNQTMEDGGPEDKAFAIAYSVANKVDGRKPSTKKSSERVARIIKPKDMQVGDILDLSLVRQQIYANPGYVPAMKETKKRVMVRVVDDRFVIVAEAKGKKKSFRLQGDRMTGGQGRSSVRYDVLDMKLVKRADKEASELLKVAKELLGARLVMTWPKPKQVWRVVQRDKYDIFKAADEMARFVRNEVRILDIDAFIPRSDVIRDERDFERAKSELEDLVDVFYDVQDQEELRDAFIALEKWGKKYGVKMG